MLEQKIDWTKFRAEVRRQFRIENSQFRIKSRGYKDV